MHAERGTLSDLCALPAPPKRLSLFESMQSQLSHSSPSPSLKPLCPTRWTVRTGAINAVIMKFFVMLCAKYMQKVGMNML